MRDYKWLLLTAGIGIGCVAHSVFSVPPARAADTPRWEHWCSDFEGLPTNAQLEKAGAEGWEMVNMAFRPPVVSNGSSVGGGATFICYKRPR